MPPSDLIAPPNSGSESTRRYVEVPDGGQFFAGADHTTINGGEFTTVRNSGPLTINNSFNVQLHLSGSIPVSQEHLTTLAGHVGTGARSVSGIETGIQPLSNAAQSEQQASPSTNSLVETFRSPGSMNPDFREWAASRFYQTLLPFGYGLPIWDPVPNVELPISYRRKGVSIGDVGLITDIGSFKYLFNITYPIDHPVNSMDLPRDLFSPSPLRSREIRVAANHTRFKPLESTGIDVINCEDGSGVLFKSSSSSASKGGLVVFPLGFKLYDLWNEDPFLQQLLDNVLKWYSYAISQIGPRARNGDLCQVTGCHCCKACGLAAFEMPDSGGFIDFNFGTNPEVEEFETFRWRHMLGTSLKAHKSHPEVADILELRGDEPSEQGRIYENLCTFVRSLNARVRGDVWDDLQRNSDSRYGCHVPQVEGEGASSNLANESSNDVDSTEPAMSTPSNTINKYLLDAKRDAKVAITSDKQWISVLKEDDTQFPRSEELIERILDNYSIKLEGEVVFLHQKTPNLRPAAKHPLPHVMASEQKTSPTGAGEHGPEKAPQALRLPNFSRPFDPPAISTASSKSDRHFGKLVESPDSDTSTLDSEECATPPSSVGSQSLGGSAKVGSRGAFTGRTESSDAMREPPLHR
ncbi:hypothetical protein M413DRAFT_449049 [Hebeloma cylindrosporum]|uniref:Uncharacterized protein n=1 Tax=Hebeloma cylindrosporum TaxID=76867 RepID=A0A0C2Y6Q9_HEBCY|nr:hypothetical protein M413DRAFT_449049 [Hebeloma cylindrosporum h7]